MASDDLEELHERINYCSNELDNLEKDINAYFKQAIYTRIAWFNARSAQVFATRVMPIPRPIQIKAGLIIHEERSILDSLAGRLAKRNGKDPHKGDKTYFPISKTKAIFESDGLQKIKKLSNTDQDIISGIIPPYGDSRLFALHEADRMRKHQDLLGVSATSSLSITGVGHIGFLASSGNHDLPLGMEVNMGFFRNVTADVGISAKVVFNDPPQIRDEDILAAIGNFGANVERIVNVFS